MADILKEIARSKRSEVEAAKELLPLSVLRQLASKVAREKRSMRHAIEESPNGIIAECKRRSPSKGEIHPAADAAAIVAGYQSAGAAACSVLTDAPYFGGALADLAIARKAATLPLLRKDFIIDEYQILQARIMGADAVLLIASLLSKSQIREYIEIAHQACLETLLEFHSYEELDKYDSGTDLTGINNRDLSTFSTDIATAAKMAGDLPEEALKVAESGIREISDIVRLRAQGYRGFLIGERFMKHPDPGLALKEFLDGNR